MKAAEHGTPARYRAGCSCEFCRAAVTAYRHERGELPLPAMTRHAAALVELVNGSMPEGPLWDRAPARWAELVAACQTTLATGAPLAETLPPVRPRVMERLSA